MPSGSLLREVDCPMKATLPPHSPWREMELQIHEAVLNAQNETELEAIRVAALGKNGQISELLKQLGSMPLEERQSKGPLLNSLRDRVRDQIMLRRETLLAAERALRMQTEQIDVTLPLRASPLSQGRIHPISQVIQEVCHIFGSMDFEVAEGPDIETDHYNFTALNFPHGHPARDMHDTFFLPNSRDNTPLLLRTHTSPVQIRTMETRKPPLRVIVPGRTYRCDSDQTHTPMFHQLEGFVIDRSSHLGHLRNVLETFCKVFFEVNKLEIRFRPSFFPFTEPSLEVDVKCHRQGHELRIGEGDDWLEILGCGMVHPNVLKNCGLDPDIYQGFAWGMGLDRIAMLKYGMPDLRNFFDANTLWLDRYGFRPFNLPELLGGKYR